MTPPTLSEVLGFDREYWQRRLPVVVRSLEHEVAHRYPVSNIVQHYVDDLETVLKMAAPTEAQREDAEALIARAILVCARQRDTLAAVSRPRSFDDGRE